MTGAEHYLEAARLTRIARALAYEQGPCPAMTDILALAQVHATLAVAAASVHPEIGDRDGAEGEALPNGAAALVKAAYLTRRAS